MSISRPSLKRRAIAFFFVTILASSLVGGYLVHFYSDQFSEDISRRNLTLAHHINDHVQGQLDHHVSELIETKKIISNIGPDDIGVIKEELDRVVAFHSLLEVVQVLDAEGSVLMITPYNDGYIGIDLSRHASFLGAQALTEQGIYWSDSFISSHTNDPAVTISLPINGGVLMAQLNLKALSDIASFSISYPNLIISITDRRGVVIAHPDQSYVTQRVNLLNQRSIQGAVDGEAKTYLEIRDGKKGLASVVPNLKSGWVVTVFQAEKDALGLVYHARNVGLVAIALLLGLTMVAFMVLQRQGMKPFKKMEEKADLIAMGSYGDDLEAEYREFTGFVESFNEMARAVRSREEALMASEEKYRLLADNAIDVIWTMDMELKYQYFSPSINLFRGVSVEEAISQTIEDAMTPDSVNLVKEILHEELEKEREPGSNPGRSRTFDLQFSHNNGSLVWGEVTCAFLRDQDGEISGIQGVTRDISERKIAEEALRNSEERYRRLFDQNPMPMWLFDTETLEILAANESAVDHYGYTKKELLGMTIRDIRPQDEIPRLEKFVAEAGPGRERAGIWKHKKKDGTIILVEIFTHDTVIDNRHCRLALVNDLTDKLDAEDALRESEERLRKISEGIFEGIVITENGVVIESNNQVAEMLGYDPEEIVGKSVMEFVAPEWKNFVLEKIKTGSEGRYAHESVRKDGSNILVEVQGTNTTYRGKEVRVSSIRDITDQRRAENILVEREKRYRIMYENNPLAYQSLSEEGIYLEVNSSWEKLLGYDRGEILGKKAMDLVDPEYFEVVEENFPKLIQSGEVIVPDIKLIKKDGTSVHISLHGKASIDEDTGRKITHCLLHDITERTRMEHALKKGAQLAAVGQVASGIAHEINNPLATISASTEALLARIPLLRETGGPDTTKEDTLDLFQDYLAMIMDEVNRSSQIIRDLLDFTRVRDYIFSETDIPNVISSTVPLLSVQSRMSKHLFKIEIAPDLPSVHGDRDRLKQVLIILLTNAVEAMPEGGTILITAAYNSSQGKVSLSIKDSGTGIIEETWGQIFEPFFTTKEMGSGTGLGLSIAETIASKHGGRIEVKANKGGGTTFTMVLPVSKNKG